MNPDRMPRSVVAIACRSCRPLVLLRTARAVSVTATVASIESGIVFAPAWVLHEDPYPARIVDHLDPVHVTAIVLHAFGRQHFTTRVALDTAHRIGQAAAVTRFTTVLPAVTILATILLLRCRLRPGIRRNGWQHRQDGNGEQLQRWRGIAVHVAASSLGGI